MTEKIKLPRPVKEDDYPDGYGPAWISEALGAPGCLAAVTRYLSDDGEATSLVLHFANGTEQLFRPARLVMTRRLTETLGALGFPIPYYQPPQLAALGQAIGRVADRARDEQDACSWSDVASLIGSWAADCLRADQSYVLRGRSGADVRAAIEHVRKGHVHGDWRVPLIVEPARNVLLAWTVPVRTVIRDRLGTMDDGDISLQLQRGELKRGRLAARPGPGEKGTVELPVWTLYNGWQGVNVEMPDEHYESGPLRLCPL